MAMCASASSVWQQEARCGETAGAEHLMFTLSMCQKLPPWTSFGPARQPEYPSAAAAHWGAPKAYLLVHFLWRGITFPTLQEQSVV